MIGLSNLYVQRLCNIVLKHNFLGVFPVDKFPTNIKKQKLPCSFIINLSESTEKGSHFTCIYITKNSIEYFDSYGMQPFISRIIKFVNKMKKEHRKFTHNATMLQPLDSYHCGLYVIAFLLSKDIKLKNKDFKNILNNLKTNDKSVEQFIMSVIRKY